ncbi:MAG: hypothetical protein FJX35_11520 [Alphaproteobacteria bacterium]|nr:hypothetical protein [Alphaproteobacteria bacterium]
MTDGAAPAHHMREACLRSIAEAIRKADDQYLRTSYVRLGESVIDALREAGYAVVPRTPTTAMMAEGHRRMIYGIHSAGTVIEVMFSAMIEAWDDEMAQLRRVARMRQLAARSRKR